MMEVWSGPISWLAMAGIAWDISGAIALSRGLFFVGDEQIKLQNATYWNANPFKQRAEAEARMDTKYGLIQLVVGFSFQFLAAAGASIPFAPAMFFFSAIAISWTIYLYNYPYWTVRDALQLICASSEGEPSEHVVRNVFKDVPEHLWQRIVVNEGFKFGEPPEGQVATNAH